MTDDPTKTYITSVRLPNADADDYLKDEEARSAITVIEGKVDGLGNLAYVDFASGSFTPAGTITAPELSVDVTSANIGSVVVSVTDKTLNLTTSSVSAVTSATASCSTLPVFTGTLGTVTVSPTTP